jgi:hypothetical protein
VPFDESWDLSDERAAKGATPLAPSLDSDVSLSQFHAAFAEAVPVGSRYSAYVSRYSVAEMKGMTPLLANDGKTGLLIRNHGDGRIEATALFNVSGVRGAGEALLRDAVLQHRVNYVECFGPRLNTIYQRLGFRDTAVHAFDPAQAPAGWNYALDGTPDYHIMRLP